MNLSNVIYISDFFLEDIIGGGELNDDVLCGLLLDEHLSVRKIRSHLVTPSFLRDNLNCFYIISNFINLRKNVLDLITEKVKYIIYEHDHKYLSGRNPGFFENFLAPKSKIVNYNFYKNSKRIIAQSSFHKEIMKKNLKLDNIENISGNLWTSRDLEFLRNLSKVEKNNRYAILRSNIAHKNTSESIRYCNAKGYKYSLVSSSNYHNFLSKLGSNNKFVFFPKTPETLSRVVVEARMMNMGTIINKNVGASYEEWFSLKGCDLVDYMTNKRHEVTQKIMGIMNEK